MEGRQGTNTKRKTSRMFSYGILDIKDDIDERLEKCHRELSSMTASLRESEIYEQLNAKVCRSSQEHDETTLALLYSILTDAGNASKSYSTLTLINRDSMGVVIHTTEVIILEKLPKLLESSRIQLVWLTREMVQNNVVGADRLCFSFLKQMPAGSTTAPDIWLAENLLHLFLDNRAWLEGQTALMTSVLYTYLALIPSHNTQPLAQLREQETKMCVSLVRNKFSECITIGRDLVRLLQNVARIPEFAELWADLSTRPEKFAPNFTGVHQILSRRTSRRFVAGRVVTDAEIKLNFLLQKVKFGQHKRYQDWFQKKYLSTPESLHLIPEMVRFICCVIHPTNEILGSDIMPRWALIGWLLSLCQPNSVVFANAKLALFYDWLFYVPDHDNIMNIEPGILLMYHSLRSHPQISATLLDFICRVSGSYNMAHKDQVLLGLKAALEDILRKGVIPSLEPFYSSPKLDEELRLLLKATFPEFSPQIAKPGMDPLAMPATAAATYSEGDKAARSKDSWDLSESGSEDAPLIIASDEDLTGEDEEIAGAFSGEEHEVGMEPDMERAVSDPWEELHKLPKPLQEKLLEMRESNSVKCLEELLGLLEMSQHGRETLVLLSRPLASCLAEDFSEGCLVDSDHTFLPQESSRLYTSLFRLLRKSNRLHPLLTLLKTYQPRLGYFLLYYLHCHHREAAGENCFAFYEQCFTVERDLHQDLTECAQNESSVFFEMLVPLLKEFPEQLVGSVEMVKLIVSHSVPQQLNSLILKLTLKEIVIFGKQNLSLIIGESTQWESYEQFCVWQLLSAEGPEAHHVVPLLRDISIEEQSEVMSGALLLLRIEPSIPGAVGNLLSLPVPSHCSLVSAVISRWVNVRPARMAKFINYTLDKVLKLSDPLPTLRTILGHLENSLQYFANKQVFEGSEKLLSHCIERVFSSYSALRTRYPTINSAVCSVLQSSHAKSPSIMKKRAESSDEDLHIRAKKRRVAVISDELSD